MDAEHVRSIPTLEPSSKIPQEWRQGPPVAPEQRWNFWPALPIAPYERRLTKRYEVVPGNGDVATPQISTKKSEFQATRRLI